MFNLTFEDKAVLDIVKGETRVRNCYLYNSETFKPVDLTGITPSILLLKTDTTCFEAVGVVTAPTDGEFTIAYTDVDVAELVEGEFQSLQLKLDDTVDVNLVDKTRLLSVYPLFC